jgi:hypothetical protein
LGKKGTGAHSNGKYDSRSTSKNAFKQARQKDCGKKKKVSSSNIKKTRPAIDPKKQKIIETDRKFNQKPSKSLTIDQKLSKSIDNPFETDGK